MKYSYREFRDKLKEALALVDEGGEVTLEYRPRVKGVGLKTYTLTRQETKMGVKRKHNGEEIKANDSRRPS